MTIPAESIENANRIAAAMERGFPPVDGLRLLTAPVQPCFDELYPEEQAGFERAIERRRNEFATGRLLIRRAMRALGMPEVPIPRGAQRQPLWPDDVAASITHSDSLVVVGVAGKGRLRSLGLDLEVADRVTPDLHDRLFSAAERDAIANGPADLAGVLFSAKEAGYKATFAINERFIGFHDAEVYVDVEAARFRFAYLGDHPPNRVMEKAEGHFLKAGRYVLSLVIIPQNS